MNSKSSRSHAIFYLHVTNRKTDTRASLYLVDLAGSERIKKSNVSGERIEEAIAINSSLTTLGKCIIALGEKKPAHVPFRESKLTKILQDALGGRCKTALIVTLSPQADDLEESVSSLLFGQRAKKVPVKPQPVEKPTEIRGGSAELKRQLELKSQLLEELAAENRRLQNEAREMAEEQQGRRDEVIFKLEQKMKAAKRDYQSRLEDMDAIMLKQEKEIVKLRERLNNETLEAQRAMAGNHGPSDSRARSRTPTGSHNRILEFPESTTGLRESNLNKANTAAGKQPTKTAAAGNGAQNPNKENDMSLEAYLATHYLVKKDDKDSKQSSQAIKDLEKAKLELEQKITKLEEGRQRLEQDKAALEELNEELTSEKEQLKNEKSQLLELIQREDEKKDTEEFRSQIDALKEELSVLREENVYLKEMTQNLESENQALEEELVTVQEKAAEGPCDKCEEVNREKNEVLSEVKVELESLKNRLTEINLENYELKDENARMTSVISELRTNEKKLLKEKADYEAAVSLLKSEQEKERHSHHETARLEQELLRQENQRTKMLEAEVEKWKRRDEEKDFQIESMGSDLAAMEAQLRIAKMRSEELTTTCQKLESTLKRMEAIHRDKEGELLEDLEKSKAQMEVILAEKADIEQDLEEINSEKLDLLNILEEYRKREALNMTNEQDLERMKGMLLECDNWSGSVTSTTKGKSLDSLILDSRRKMEEYVDQLMSNNASITSKLGPDTIDSPFMHSYKQTIKKTLVGYLSQSYFSEFEKNTLEVNSGRQLQDLLVEEYIRARQCIKELSANLETQIFNFLSSRLENKSQEKRLQATHSSLQKFKRVLKDPAVEELRNEFVRVWLTQIRENRAAYKLQAFFKLIRQKKKSLNLQKRHKSQYERFQAGSGKNLLQLLMKKVEQSMCTIYEEVGMIEEDFKAINVAKKNSKKLLTN